MPVTHPLVSTVVDEGVAGEVSPDDWNANHVGDISDFIVVNETPSGTIDGVNVTFTLAATPVVGTVKVWLNGLLLKSTTHYTISGSTITMLTGSIPETGDYLLADYLKTVS